MDVLTWFKELWQKSGTQSTYLWIDPTHVDSGGSAAKPTALVAGQHYFRLWLVEMLLQNTVQWGTQFHPAVYSVVRFRFGNSDEVLSHIAGQSSIKDLDLAKLNSSVAVNYAVTPLVPFNGGEIELEAGLLAVPGTNNVKSMIKLLGDFSKLLVVPQLSAALAIAAPLADGISEMVGATAAKPQLRLHDTWTANNGSLRSGYFVVISSPLGRHQAATLWVKGGRLYEGTGGNNLQPVTGFHYMLFRIEAESDRDDWDSLTAIEEPYQQAIEMVQNSVAEADPDLKKKMLSEADRRLGAAKLAAFRAKELTKIVGRNQVIEALGRRFEEAKKQLGAAAFGREFSPKLKAALENRISVAEAAAKGEMREEELWSA
jgi:hypothetical protein